MAGPLIVMDFVDRPRRRPGRGPGSGPCCGFASWLAGCSRAACVPGPGCARRGFAARHQPDPFGRPRGRRRTGASGTTSTGTRSAGTRSAGAGPARICPAGVCPTAACSAGAAAFSLWRPGFLDRGQPGHLAQRVDLIRRQRPRLPQFQVTQGQGPDRPAQQAQGRIADCGRHVANLPLLALAQHHAQPYALIGSLAELERGRQVADDHHLRRRAAPFRQVDAVAQPHQCLLGRLFAQQHIVCLGVLVARVCQPVGQLAVVRQQHQSFAVQVEPANRKDPIVPRRQ